jgi:enoyl-[acyl-carrier protein] reductase II
MKNRICTLFQIEKPIIQAGMIWCSGWELAAAVSEAGGLGLIGAGSMYPDILREQIRKCKQATSKPFGVNIPLLYPDIDKHMQVLIEEGVKIVFTSAGNPKTWTTQLKEKGMTVVHVVSGLRFAVKCQEAGVDAIVAEGFEAGGHNGREETTTLVLIPAIRKAINIPLIAAGGIGSGEQMAAAFALGAEAVQIGSRFVASVESSAHENFKKAVVQAAEGDTSLRLKQLTPVRLLRNKFSNEVAEAEKRGAGAEELSILLGRARAKKGMFEGDLEEGELEIGQVSANIDEIKPASEIVEEIYQQFKTTLAELKQTLSNF